ncbi:tRNA (uracil-5-)-methyltransferase homolog A isoform X2 [Aricia agestis]|uniref:tRNA (uracil-5-)-methyltransferase homolog A isoform X2 n=1 Tax=Aricia agestis TaxID=91739 RepID=UPI001C20A42D|nr:tRNA (uracil-5-)-methyltransferase homolog A isoform X2 [Aricia agestis]
MHNENTSGNEEKVSRDDNGVATQENSTVNEEYAYLDRGGFSSERFKIELRGLPKFYGIAELKKLMNQKLGLSTSKIKRPKNGSHWLYACFQNNEDRTKAINALNGYVWKGKTLIAEEAKPAPDPLVKRKLEEDSNVQRKKKKEDEGKSQEERLKDAVIPFWNVSYEEQLKRKENEIRKTLMHYENEVWKVFKNRRKEIEANRKIYNGLSFELKLIQKSPVTEGYRNKSEFTVGIDEETQKPTVGFRLGSYVTGTVGVAPIHMLKHIPEETKKAVSIFQDFVRSSDLAPYSPADYTGYWRYLTVRQSTYSGELMVIVSMYPQELSSEELEKLKTQLIECFSTEDSKACGIRSLYFHLLTKKRVGDEDSKATHLMGPTHITDSILGLKFRISPEAFFQINTACAELLYSSAIELSRATADSTVLDICCGTGTIGLCFAKHVNKVLGLEIIPEAVKDAKANAAENGVTNCDFFTGKAEDILPSVLARATGDDIIAIVDPPRAGLHMRAITTLRNAVSVRRIVYVSCHAAAATRNLTDLARPATKTLRGPPFRPAVALPLDMFPHTPHLELVLLLEREAPAVQKKSDDSEKMESSTIETENETEPENKEESVQ